MKYKACAENEIPSGSMKNVRLEGRQVLIANVKGKFFAIADTCSHAAASLSEGILTEYEVQCPLHGAIFDVRTGKVLSPPATDALQTYGITVDKGNIYVELDDQ